MVMKLSLWKKSGSVALNYAENCKEEDHPDFPLINCVTSKEVGKIIVVPLDAFWANSRLK